VCVQVTFGVANGGVNVNDHEHHHGHREEFGHLPAFDREEGVLEVLEPSAAARKS
jgi:hypothetical protein